MHDYETIKETAERWGCSTRWVLSLATRGKIPGAQKVGRDWLIPADAQRPQEPRGRRWTAKAEKPEQMKGGRWKNRK